MTQWHKNGLDRHQLAHKTDSTGRDTGHRSFRHNAKATNEQKRNPNRSTDSGLTPQDVDNTITAETYTTLPSGKVMVCELTLRNGFTVRGEAAVVSKANFNVKVNPQAL